MAFVAANFTTLASTPPTPPHEVARDIEDAMKFLDTSFDDLNPRAPPLAQEQIANGPSMTTPPPSSPATSTDPAPPAAEVPVRKIRFSQHTEEIKTATPEDSEDGSYGGARTQPLKAQIPFKSILKPFTPTPSSNNDNAAPSSMLPPAYRYSSLAAMLESVTQQLGGNNRNSRMDAYMMLSGTMKAYSIVPEPESIVEILPLLEHFIRRDLQAKTGATGSLDCSLVAQALRLALCITSKPFYFRKLGQDFIAELRQSTISAIQASDLPKGVMTHYLLLLIQTPLLRSALTLEDANNIFTSLESLPERCAGKTVYFTRLLCYQILAEEARQVMLERVPEWLLHVFHGMLFCGGELRKRAIDACMKIGIAIGHTSRVTKGVQEYLDEDAPNAYYFQFEFHIENLLHDPDDKVCSPSAWSAVTLLLRSKQYPLKNWPYFMRWMKLIQRAFNSSDSKVNSQAFYAWNRLVFTLKPVSNEKPSMLKLLRQPIVSRLTRKNTDKDAKLVREAAFGSYWTLLYYAFSPLITPDQLDLCWEELVTQVVREPNMLSESNADNFCEALTALFGGSNLRVWEEFRGVSGDRMPVKPEDLPRLDVRWVRRQCFSIFNAVEPLLKSASWYSTAGENTAVKKMWISLMKALAEAGSKEITTSTELKHAIAIVMAVLHRICESKQTESNLSGDIDGTADSRFIFLTRSMVEHLGTANMGREILRKTTGNTFEVALTAPRSDDEDHENHISPADALLQMLAKFGVSNGCQTDLDLELQELVNILQSIPASPLRPHILQKVTPSMLSTVSIIQPASHNSIGQSPQPAGHPLSERRMSPHYPRSYAVEKSNLSPTILFSEEITSNNVDATEYKQGFTEPYIDTQQPPPTTVSSKDKAHQGLDTDAAHNGDDISGNSQVHNEVEPEEVGLPLDGHTEDASSLRELADRSSGTEQQEIEDRALSPNKSDQHVQDEEWLKRLSDRGTSVDSRSEHVQDIRHDNPQIKVSGNFQHGTFQSEHDTQGAASLPEITPEAEVSKLPRDNVSIVIPYTVTRNRKRKLEDNAVPPVNRQLIPVVDALPERRKLANRTSREARTPASREALTPPIQETGVTAVKRRCLPVEWPNHRQSPIAASTTEAPRTFDNDAYDEEVIRVAPSPHVAHLPIFRTTRALRIDRKRTRECIESDNGTDSICRTAKRRRLFRLNAEGGTEIRSTRRLRRKPARTSHGDTVEPSMASFSPTRSTAITCPSTPKSPHGFIGRLRSILSDCKEILLGSPDGGQETD